MANREHLKILMQGVKVWNKRRKKNPHMRPDLSGADLVLSYLRDANFSRADLSKAVLFESNLNGANLSRADLSDAKLDGANLSHANVRDANFTNATLSSTILADLDLSNAKGLETVIHFGPSTIGIDTIYQSGGNIPESFLRGCGVPDTFIAYARSLVGTAIDFYSAFISYSSKNENFAERLYADLQNKGVRCWFAPEDLKIGDRFQERIEESIRVYDKLLIILSEESISSRWVEREVNAAFENEEKKQKTMLFPIRLDDAVMDCNQAWAADIRRSRHIGDFTRWKEHDEYQKAFGRLMRDLKADAAREE